VSEMMVNPDDFNTEVVESGAAEISEDPASPSSVEDLWEVKVNGKNFKVPREELIAGYQRQQDYTAKTMKLAEERRAWEKVQREHAQYSGEREQLKKFLQDKAAMQEYLRQLDQNENPSPDQPVTAAQLRQFQAAERQRQAAERSQMMEELQIRQTAAVYEREIDTAIGQALSQFPELKSVRRINDVLKSEVAERQPTTIEEAKELFAVVAKEQADALRTFAIEEKKKSAVKVDQLKNGIEPPGGTGIQPKPEKHALGSQALRDAFMASLQESK
jgi:hypothetical protein